MNGSIYTGTSGLLAFQKALDVESNNIANVNTVGFKSDTVSFSDLMYQNDIGKGVSMNEPTKSFEQGALVETGINYDFAIQGEGFFTIAAPQDTSVQYYTRAGDFRRSDESYLVGINEMFVMGTMPVISGDPIPSHHIITAGASIAEDKETVTSVNTFMSDYKKTVTSTGETGAGYKTMSTNLDDIDRLKSAYQVALNLHAKDIKEGDEALTQQDTMQFDIPAITPSSYNVEVKIDGSRYQQSFDTSVQNTLNLLSDKINMTTGVVSFVDETGLLTINSMVAGQKLTITDAKQNNSKILVENKVVASGSGQNLVDAIYNQLDTLLKANGAELSSIKSVITKTVSSSAPTLDTIGLDLYDLGILELDPNSLSKNIFGNLSNDNGNIYLEHGDAKYLVGRLDAVSFQNNSGLSPAGYNLYSKTAESGDPIYMEESAEIVNNYLELSTADLSKNLVSLMVWQKAFEANSKSVTTSDELLKTALQLKN
ncbi:MAG: flagellar hook-basal body complex protein [Campylobacterota bacterium]|nr:flagellar hook-basal body complex protein [Campylobacterota bacterium]